MKRKIILIEDEEALAYLYVFTLEKEYDIKWVSNTKDAAELLKTFKADIFLVDHGMRYGVSGGESLPVFKELRPDAYFVLFSNYSWPILKDRYDDENGNNVLELAHECWDKNDVSLETLKIRLKRIEKKFFSEVKN